MGKVIPLSKLTKVIQSHKKEGKTVGLITGCFDIIHIGHIQLFRFAKKRCDIVVVGLDNDETIKLSKGKGRPIHKLKHRADTLSDISNIDYIFSIEEVFLFGSQRADLTHKRVVRAINPNYLITNTQSDRFWKEKENMANETKISFLKDTRKRVSASTSIVDKLNSDF